MIIIVMATLIRIGTSASCALITAWKNVAQLFDFCEKGWWGEKQLMKEEKGWLWGGNHVQGSVALPWDGVHICSLGQDQPANRAIRISLTWQTPRFPGRRHSGGLTQSICNKFFLSDFCECEGVCSPLNFTEIRVSKYMDVIVRMTLAHMLLHV